ncbi:MAG TPA: hypothetical protein VN380_21275 [Thermoanaerobaculia bacterium]|jgi:hypothetical protein|nr:hypothetical protein [Thermoanaerobaculia bacterium]
MRKTVTNTLDPSNPDPAPDPAKLAPEAVIAQLRAMRSQIEDIAPLSQQQRNQVKQRIRKQPATVVAAAINVIGVVDNLSQAIGQPLDEVRQLQDDSLRWDAVAEEARAFLKVIEGSNLNRHQQLVLIGMQAYSIGTQLAKAPGMAVLVPHVEEVKRLKAVSRRKKATPAPQTPAPTPEPAPVPVTSTTPKA